MICLYGVAADECTDAINIGNIKRSAWYILGQYEEPLSDIGIDPSESTDFKIKCNANEVQRCIGLLMQNRRKH